MVGYVRSVRGSKKREAALFAALDKMLPRKDGSNLCSSCTENLVVEDGLCRDCWDEINGQFGVGA